MRISDWSSDVCSSDLVVDVALLDEVRGVAHRAGGVVEQRLLLLRGHQPEQVTGLLEVVVVVVAVVPPVRVAADLQRRLAVLRLFLPLVEAVGFVVRQAAVVAVGAALAVADRKSTRLNSSHSCASLIPSSA